MARRKKLTKAQQVAKAIKRREKTAAADRAAFKAIQDIGILPRPVDRRRRDACAGDLRAFCERYFAQLFPLAWSSDHLKVIAKIERVILAGGMFAIAMPRGSGKSTLCQVAVVWAALYGHRSFVVLVCATDEDATLSLDNIKSHLTRNELIRDDFPEGAIPFRELEGVALRATGQRYKGDRTHIKWSSDRIVFATIPGAKCSGAVICARGLTGHIRGLNHVRPDGVSIRPDLVIPDDPQTDASARSPSQVLERKSLISGTLMNLAGPGKRIAMIMPCTVIQKDDVSDRFLNDPQWQGERCKAIYSFPQNEEIWNEYAAIKEPADRTEFYSQHREIMDAGAVVAWPANVKPGDLSALQSAMNERYKDESVFFAEFQQEPLSRFVSTESKLSAPTIAERINYLAHRVSPVWAEILTAFADVHDNVIYYAVCAFDMGFTGAVIDYGTFPDQHMRRFQQSNARRTLKQMFPTAGKEGAIRQGLEAVATRIVGSEWKREDGTHLRINQMFIDAGYKTTEVHEFCRRSSFAPVLLPSRGIGIGAADKPMSEYYRKAGERIGLNWYLPKPTAAQGSRQIRFDSNWWKSFVAARLSATIGDRGNWTLFGRDPRAHDLFAENLCAEVPIRTEGRGRVVEAWRQPPDRPDNHWWDCVVGCAVAANFRAGVTLAAVTRLRERPKVVDPVARATVAAKRAARRVQYL